MRKKIRGGFFPSLSYTQKVEMLRKKWKNNVKEKKLEYVETEPFNQLIVLIRTQTLHNAHSTVFSFFALHPWMTYLICYGNVCTCPARRRSQILPVCTSTCTLHGTTAEMMSRANARRQKPKVLITTVCLWAKRESISFSLKQSPK